MEMERFGIQSLATMEGGKIARQFERAIRHAILDATENPNNEKARKVVIQFNSTPCPPESGENLDRVDVTALVRQVTPTHSSAVHTMKVGKAGVLSYNPGSPDEPNQGTLDE